MSIRLREWLRQHKWSTGHITLDDLALATFRKWRFRPGTVSRVHIPITFYIRGLYVRTWGDRPWLNDVTNWLVPYYPISAIYKVGPAAVSRC
ncbi:MAG TPA: energy transducer TonB [Candidatus Udaeobacter sp.]|nr:energy transducer TonB [Candidatus Udaeobacter sp.]